MVDQGNISNPVYKLVEVLIILEAFQPHDTLAFDQALKKE